MMITVHGCCLLLVEYQGQRVVTFEMIDEVHNKHRGAARRTFNRYRSYFREGKDYINATASLMRLIVPLGFSVPNRGQILLTKTGYLLLVKNSRIRCHGRFRTSWLKRISAPCRSSQNCIMVPYRTLTRWHRCHWRRHSTPLPTWKVNPSPNTGSAAASR